MSPVIDFETARATVINRLAREEQAKLQAEADALALAEATRLKAEQLAKIERLRALAPKLEALQSQVDAEVAEVAALLASAVTRLRALHAPLSESCTLREIHLAQADLDLSALRGPLNKAIARIVGRDGVVFLESIVDSFQI